MAITSITYKDKNGQAPGDPFGYVVVTLNLDATYPIGGYAGFKALVLAACKGYISTDITILNVEQNNFPMAVWCTYDRLNDKLRCFDDALVEYIDTSDLHLATGLELVVFYK